MTSFFSYRSRIALSRLAGSWLKQVVKLHRLNTIYSAYLSIPNTPEAEQAKSLTITTLPSKAMGTIVVELI
jgi:hypothetical protein